MTQGLLPCLDLFAQSLLQPVIPGGSRLAFEHPRPGLACGTRTIAERPAGYGRSFPRRVARPECLADAVQW